MAMMDEALIKALNDMSDDFGMPRLDEILGDPEPYVYQPDERTHE